MRIMHLMIVLTISIISSPVNSSDADILIESQSKIIECASAAYLLNDFDKSTNMLNLAAEHINDLIDLRNSGDKISNSWFEFQSYEFLSRDYILGHDYGYSIAVMAARLREEHGRSNMQAIKKSIEDLYDENRCEYFEKFFP